MIWKPCATMLILVMAATSGWTQDAAPGQDQTEDPEPVPVQWNSFTLGYTSIANGGNNQVLRQYASPSRGFDLKHLRYTYPGQGGRFWGRLDLRGFPKNDNVQTLQIIAGKANLKFTSDDYGYFEPSPFRVDRRVERNVQGSLSYAVNPNLGVWAMYRNRTKDRSYEPPRDNLSTITKTLAVGVEGNVLGGHAAITYSDSRFYDRNGVQPTSVQKRYDVSYGREFGPLSLEGVYSNTKIQQRGFQDSNAKGWGLDADWNIGESTTLGMSLRRQDLSLPNTQNAYVRKRFITAFNLDHRFGNGIGLQAGFQHKEAERLRSDQTFVDVPKWNTWNARLNGKLGSSNLRWSLRGSWEHLNRSATMIGEDPRALYWDDRARLQAKLDYTNDRFAAYATYQYRFDQNSPRNVEVTSNFLTLGGSYTFNANTSAWAEFAHQSYRASGVVDVDGYDLDWFFPSNTSYAFGIDHAFNPSTSLSVALTHTVTNNDNPLGLRGGNVRNTELTATLRRKINERNALELVVAPWAYRDRLSGQMNSRPTMIGLNWTMKF